MQGPRSEFELTGAKKLVVSKWWADERDILVIKVIFSHYTFENEDKVRKSSEKVLLKTKMAEN